MKTSELIKLLQEVDPKDECTICVNNHPVSDVDRMPYYYDGRLELVERDDYYQVTRVGYKAGGDKIKIRYDTVEDALMDYPDAELELSGITYQGKVDSRYMDSINQWIADGKEYVNWKQLSQAALNKGQPQPPILISAPALSIQQKMHKWLQSLGIITGDE